MIQYVIAGLATGSLYALLGLGLALIQRSTNVLNFAQGELSMLMAFSCYFFMTSLGLSAPLAFIGTLLVATVAGLLIYNVVIYPNRRRDHESLAIITLGMKLAITGIAALVFGAASRIYPPVFAVDRYQAFGLMIGAGQAWTIGVSVVAMVVLTLFMKYAPLGLAMRAASQDVDVAQLLGVDLRVVGSTAWIIAIWLATITGILLSTTVMLSPYMMGLTILKAFAALIIGGMTSLPGVIAGGLMVGVFESLVAWGISPLFQESMALVLIIAVLLVRPDGLFNKAPPWRA